jgi:hypothetical protein
MIVDKVSISEAVALAVAVPSTTYRFTGSPGVGKTIATAAMLRDAGYATTVVPCQNIPIEDMAALPVVDKKTCTTTFAPNKMWAPIAGKQAFVLDELPKAPEDVFNAFNALLYGAPKSFMTYEYSPDTLVIVTGNSAVFNAGDNIRPHHVNRMVNLEIADPTPAEALATMTLLGFDARIVEWAQAVPAALVSFDPAMQKDKAKGADLQTYFGFLERDPARPFCSMRSLETASRLLSNAAVPVHVLRAALAGAIGPVAASSLAAYLAKYGEFVPAEDILTRPATALVPRSMFDQRLAAASALAVLNKTNYTAVLEYVDRLHPDIKANVFAPRLMHKPKELHFVSAIAKLMASI